MPPQKPTISDRVGEFAQHHMYIFDKRKQIMMCACCEVRVNWQKKSVIQNHIDSDNHRTKKVNYESELLKQKSKQISITESVKRGTALKCEREQFIQDTVEAFLRSNIPLEKLESESLRSWKRKYVKG